MHSIRVAAVLIAFISTCCNAAAAAAVLEQLPTGRIIGGTEAVSINLPWTVSLSSYGWHNCGGSIITKRTILTAAHCLFFANTRGLRVMVGAKKRSAQDGIIMMAESIHYHKQFDFITMDYDIGMLRLEKDLQFSNVIQPIALPKYGENVDPGTKAIVAGWGFSNILGPAVDYLRYAFVPVVSQQKCNQLIGDISDRMICAGYMAGGVDACALDSGGPLVANNKLIGIVSWGIGCAVEGKPGVYTRVSELVPWIEEQLAVYNEKL